MLDEHSKAQAESVKTVDKAKHATDNAPANNRPQVSHDVTAQATATPQAQETASASAHVPTFFIDRPVVENFAHPYTGTQELRHMNTSPTLYNVRYSCPSCNATQEQHLRRNGQGEYFAVCQNIGCGHEHIFHRNPEGRTVA